MSTPPTTRPPQNARAEELLLEFLSENDAPCPVCGYNLRGLATPTCPECRQQLVLSVGTRRLLMGWLFFAIAPGFFSGIAACFLVFPTVGVYMEDGLLIAPFIVAVLFGWTSGIFAIVLAVKRTLFLKQSWPRRASFAIAIWIVHFIALIVVALLMAPYWS